MAEPTSNAAAGIAIATGAVTITGSVFGLQYDALLFGLFGGLLSLMHLDAMSLKRTVATLASAAITGALFAPVAVGFAQGSVDWIAKVPAQPLRLGCALLIGCFLQAIVQLVLAWLKGRAKQYGGAA